MQVGASLLLAVILATSCPVRTAETAMLGAARAALDHLDARRELVVVLPDDAPPELRSAVAQLRSTKPRSEVAETDAASFPAGHLLLQTLEVNGDSASVSALLGPVPKAKPGEILLDCGTRYSFTMTRAGGVWKVGAMSIAVC